MQATKRIVIGIDGSDASREAFALGLRLARASGSVVTLVHVRHALLPTVGDPFYGRVLSETLHEARATVAEAAALAAEQGVECETEILEGEAAAELLRLARVRDAQLIVVGSRGLGAIAGAILGSVSNALVLRADRPVLVVKERATPEQRVA